ncbi:MAG: TonB-dependent receptor [Bryobacterales bacterium]|nr:TonB-dependent receptor [Bryobacterales bacterium]
MNRVSRARWAAQTSLFILLALVLTAPLLAQIDTGIISGRVTDPTGAAVPGARLTITQTQTNVVSNSETNAEGLFRVPSLRTGSYRVSVSAPGFKALTREGLTLRVGENLNVELALEVGSVTETVEVVSSLPLLETQTSAAGQVMTGDYFYQLPNFQHWTNGVLYYTPQIQHTDSAWPGSLGAWSINGGTASQIGYFEDGQLATRGDGNLAIRSVQVGLEEVKVLSSVLPAEYGHATSGGISVVKRSGTNLLHGQGGYLFRNDLMSHRRFFQALTNEQQGISTMFNQPDFTVSGPVYIPKVYNGMNKTFFNVAGTYHFDSNGNASSYSVPTPAMLGGDFNFPGVTANQIYDPASTIGTPGTTSGWSRAPMPGNIIPSNRISDMWKAIMANKPFAEPNNPGSYTATGVSGNILKSGFGYYHGYGTQFRVDHSFKPSFKMFGSLVWNNNNQPSINNVVLYLPYDAGQRYTMQRQHVATIGFTYTISPTAISETRIGEYRQDTTPAFTNEDYQFAIAKTVPKLPDGVYLNPVNIGYSTQGKYGNGNLGLATRSVNVSNNHQFRQDFTVIYGRHSFKTGYEYLWDNRIQRDIPGPRLTLGFGGTSGLQSNGQSMPNTGGIALADVMLGYVSNYNYVQQGASFLPVNDIHSFYLQDDWRILPNLTLNLGVRYSNESPAHTKWPRQLSVGSLTKKDTYFTDSIPNVVTCPQGGCVGGWIQPDGGLYNRDWNNFQPRLGFAWTVTPNTVIRGGWALMTKDMGIWWTNQAEIGGSSFFNTGTVTAGNNNYHPLFNVNGGVPTPVYPALLADGSLPSAGSTPQNRANGTLAVIPMDFHNPYTQNWHFTIQRALKQDFLLELTYSGSHNVGFQGTYNWQSRPYGTGLDPSGNVIDLTQQANWAYRATWVQSGAATQAYKPYTSWNNVNWYANNINRVYHSGTVKAEKRYSAGLTFLTFFTWQKGLENSPGNTYKPDNVGRAITGQTQKFRFTSSMTYELPLGRGKRYLNGGGRLLEMLVGGYSFAWNYSQYSRNPTGVSYTGASYRNPVTGVMGARQDYPGYEPLVGSSLFLIQAPQLRDNWQDLGNNRFVQAAQNPVITNCGTAINNWGNNCVVVAPSFTNGNMPGNVWRPMRVIAANASMYKDFPIKERLNAQIRLDFMNPFKWYNWSNPTTAMSQTSPGLFGTIPLGDFADSTEGGPPFLMLSFRVNF